MAIGMTGWKQPFVKIVIDPPVRLIITLALFVLYNTDLVVEFLLGNGAQQMSHPVRLQPQDQVQRWCGHRLEIVGSIQRGRTIQAGRTHLLHGLKPFTVIIFAAVEHQMFKQVSKPCLACQLIL